MSEEYLPGAEEATPEPETTTEAVAVVPATQSPLAARDAGIAAYLASAYGKAGTLRLTTEETKLLKADFPDDAFVTGAAGKESLIYIDPRRLRDRMDEALGLGGWSLVPIRTWTEEYKTSTGPAIRVYRECVLIVRGVFITQATGDMSYFPSNQSQNYGDAYQGAESHSLRRCLKNFGIGLQAYSKVFQAGWFERQRAGNAPGRTATSPPPSTSTPPKQTPPAGSQAAKPTTPKIATANTRAFVLDQLGCTEEGVARNTLHGYLVALGWLENEKTVEQWPARFVPISKEEIEALKVGLGAFSLSGIATRPYQPHGLDPATLQGIPVTPVAPKAAAPTTPEPAWMQFPMPFGKSKGTPLGKFPETELRFYMDQFKVRESIDVQNPDGTITTQPLPPESIESQKLLRAALDEAAAHFSKQQPATKG